ncbi:hypothetical protein MRX96_022785 [Rhipicephalus microplus]
MRAALRPYADDSEKGHHASTVRGAIRSYRLLLHDGCIHRPKTAAVTDDAGLISRETPRNGEISFALRRRSARTPSKNGIKSATEMGYRALDLMLNPDTAGQLRVRPNEGTGQHLTTGGDEKTTRQRIQ